MFGSGKLSKLEAEADRAVRDLANHPVGSQDYVRTLDQVVKLHKMMEEEKSSSVSKNTLIGVSANLLGILMILAHEWTGPVTSRALSLVFKPRV